MIPIASPAACDAITGSLSAIASYAIGPRSRWTSSTSQSRTIGSVGETHDRPPARYCRVGSSSIGDEPGIANPPPPIPRPMPTPAQP
jgi:hypothetical protein